MTKKLVNEIAYKIVGCAIEVHKNLGPGLLESVYHKCMLEELYLNGLYAESQIEMPVIYKGKSLDAKLRLDILVNNIIIVELKAVEEMIPLFKAQLLTYLKLTAKPKGLLINFNCENITKHLVPIVTDVFSCLPES